MLGDIMFEFIKKYINSLTKEHIINFSIKNNINLNDKEIDTIYNVLKNELEELLNNTNIILNKYENNFSVENFIKIKELISIYKKRYKNYL